MGLMESSSQIFAEESSIDVLVPESDLDIEGIHAAAEDGREIDFSSLLPSVTQRSLLFFDELVFFCVVLKTSYHDEAHLKSILSRLRIFVEVEAIDSAMAARGPGLLQDPSSARQKDILWSGIINRSEEPIIVVQEHNTDSGQQTVLVIWKNAAFIGRPRIRLHKPNVIFRTTAEVLSSGKPHKHQIEDQALPSHTPASINLLESLRGDPALEGVEPRLSALRLSALLPPTRKRSVHESYTITKSMNRTFPLKSAIGAKVRYNKSPNNSNPQTLIALLEVEATISSGIRISLEKITTRLTEGSVEDLTASNGVHFPMQYRARDTMVFLYRLSPSITAMGVPRVVNESRALKITIEATVLVSETCQPRVRMQWNTLVDFTIALNSNYGNAGLSLYQRNRSASLQKPSSYGGKVSRPTRVQRDSTTFDERRSPDEQQEMPTNYLGITATCTAPAGIKVGIPFHVDILIVNHTDKPRDLAVVPIIQFRKGDANLSKPGVSSSVRGVGRAKEITEAVLEDNVVYLMSAGLGGTKLLSLNTDFRIGYLEGGSARNFELRFLPLSLGVMPLDAIRVIDVLSNEVADIRNLPDLVAEDRELT